MVYSKSSVTSPGWTPFSAIVWAIRFMSSRSIAVSVPFAAEPGLTRPVALGQDHPIAVQVRRVSGRRADRSLEQPLDGPDRGLRAVCTGRSYLGMASRRAIIGDYAPYITGDSAPFVNPR